MAAGAYGDVAILGLTYAEDAVSSYPDSDPDVTEVLSNEDERIRTSIFDPQVI